jgi:uncharacterized spore protein YtfJ
MGASEDSGRARRFAVPTFTELMQEANTSIGAKRVFADPYEKNGITIIPAARVMGGLGGGEGEGPAVEGGGTAARSSGMGGGFGISGGPAGAYVIKGETVTWLPAIDVNRLMLGFQVVMIVFFLTVRSIARARAKASGATR